MTATLPPDYQPSDDEPFMNEVMLEYFRKRLVDWKESLVRDSGSMLAQLQTDTSPEPDATDRATVEAGRSVGLRTRDRARKLIIKIDCALTRIEEGTYGYCEETGDPISLKRLEARPVATLSLEAQERHERMEKTQRDD